MSQQNAIMQLKPKIDKMMSIKTEKPFWRYKSNLQLLGQYIQECKKQEANYELVQLWKELERHLPYGKKWTMPSEIQGLAYDISKIFEDNEQYADAINVLNILILARTGYDYTEHMRHEDLKENLINEIKPDTFIRIKKLSYKTGKISAEDLGIELERIIEIYGINGLEVNKKGMAYILAPEEYLKLYFDEKDGLSDILNILDKSGLDINDDLDINPKKRIEFFEKNFNQGMYSINRVFYGKEKFSGFMAFNVIGTDIIIIDKIFNISEDGNKSLNLEFPTSITNSDNIGQILSDYSNDNKIELDEKYYKNLIEKVNLNLNIGESYFKLIDDPQCNSLDENYEKFKKKKCRRIKINDDRKAIIEHIEELIIERENCQKDLKRAFFERGKWEAKRKEYLNVASEANNN